MLNENHLLEDSKYYKDILGLPKLLIIVCESRFSSLLNVCCITSWLCCNSYRKLSVLEMHKIQNVLKGIDEVKKVHNPMLGQKIHLSTHIVTYSNVR